MINIGLCGLGTVGSGVYEIINNNSILSKEVKINKILVSNLNKKRDVENSLLTTNYKDIVDDKNINLVIECIGGTTLAYDIIKESLLCKKNVITANKAVLAIHLEELSQIAKDNNVSLLFEASVCAAIPVISTISQIHNYDSIYKIEGIINGSTNYILSRTRDGLSFENALKEAKDKGFLESDPTDDIKGFDALRKIIILSKIAYKASFDTNILVYPMDNLTDNLINYTSRLGLSIKYLATSEKINDKLEITLMPTCVKNNESLANVMYEKNHIKLHTKYSNSLDLEGFGAGKNPTASAIISDLFKIRENKSYSFEFDSKLKLINLRHKYIIESKEDLDLTKIERKENNIYFTKEILQDELNVLLKKSICFARID